MRRWLWLGLVWALPVSAQEAELRAHFEADGVDRYRIEATIDLAQDGDEAIGSRKLEQSVNVRLRTVAVHPDGRALVAVSFERVEALLVETPRGGEARERRFTWNEGAPAGDALDEFGQVWTVATGAVLQCMVEPDGRVSRVEGAEQLGEQLDGLGVEGARAMLGVVAPTVLATTLTKVWGVDPIGGERAPGDRWGLTEQVRVSGSRTARREITLKLERIEDGVAMLTGEVRMAPGEPSDASVVDVSMEGAGTVEVAWNLTRGTTDWWNEWSEVKLIATLGADGPRVTTSVNRRLKLNRLDDD